MMGVLWCRCITVSGANGRNSARCPEPSPSSTVSSSASADTETPGLLPRGAHTHKASTYTRLSCFIDCLNVLKALPRVVP